MKTIEEVKKHAEEVMRIAHDKHESILPEALLWSSKDDALTVLGLDLNPHELNIAVAEHGKTINAYAAVLILEVWQVQEDPKDPPEWKGLQPKDHPRRRDVVTIWIDHPDGFFRGLGVVTEGATPRVGPLEWLKHGEDGTTLGNRRKLLHRADGGPGYSITRSA